MSLRTLRSMLVEYSINTLTLEDNIFLILVSQRNNIYAATINGISFFSFQLMVGGLNGRNGVCVQKVVIMEKRNDIVIAATHLLLEMENIALAMGFKYLTALSGNA